MTPEQVQRRREMAQALAQDSMSTAPVGHWTQALARGLGGYLSGRSERIARRAEDEGLAGADEAIAGNPVLSALMGQPGAAQGMPQGVVNGNGADGTALDLLREFEGFRETPYWDVNALRTGYGSDTITTADGRVVPVTEGVRVSREDAERDLHRRVATEFEPRARQAAGAAWDALAEPQRAALTSIAYNYGSIPSPVAQALQTGGDVPSAIMSLASHNDGVNADRRAREAQIFSGAGGIPVQTRPQAPSGVVAALAEAQSNPWVAQKYGPVINALMQQEMGRQDASYQQQLRQADPMYQAQLANLNKPEVNAYDQRAAAAAQYGLQPGTPEFQQFVLGGSMNGGADSRVQSSDILADGTVVTVMSDGTPRVVSPSGEVLAGQAAADAVRAAREFDAQNQRSVYEGRRSGTLSADAELGAAASAAGAVGTASVASGMSAWEDYSKLQSSLANIDEAITAIDGGAESGLIYNMLPNITEASASLNNAMNRMGLDVIGSVTFGALSEAEMRLAMETAAPRNLRPAELRSWLVRKREAQEKAAAMLADAAQYLTTPGNTINGWIARNRATQKDPPARRRWNPELGDFE